MTVTTMPTCTRCNDRPANVVYRATSDQPIPRCWTCAPQMSEAHALGWLPSISDAGPATGPEGGDVHSPRPERDVAATPANKNSAHAGCHRLGA